MIHQLYALAVKFTVHVAATETESISKNKIYCPPDLLTHASVALKLVQESPMEWAHTTVIFTDTLGMELKTIIASKNKFS